MSLENLSPDAPASTTPCPWHVSPGICARVGEQLLHPWSAQLFPRTAEEKDDSPSQQLFGSLCWWPLAEQVSKPLSSPLDSLLFKHEASHLAWQFSLSDITCCLIEIISARGLRSRIGGMLVGSCLELDTRETVRTMGSLKFNPSIHLQSRTKSYALKPDFYSLSFKKNNCADAVTAVTTATIVIVTLVKFWPLKS